MGAEWKHTLKGESAASLISMRSHSSPVSASGGSCENKRRGSRCQIHRYKVRVNSTHETTQSTKLEEQGKHGFHVTRDHFRTCASSRSNSSSASDSGSLAGCSSSGAPWQQTHSTTQHNTPSSLSDVYQCPCRDGPTSPISCIYI
jgi:hypothetical protein